MCFQVLQPHGPKIRSKAESAYLRVIVFSLAVTEKANARSQRNKLKTQSSQPVAFRSDAAQRAYYMRLARLNCLICSAITVSHPLQASRFHDCCCLAIRSHSHAEEIGASREKGLILPVT